MPKKLIGKEKEKRKSNETLSYTTCKNSLEIDCTSTVKLKL